MIFSKKLRKTAASVLALVMVFAMSTGAFASTGYGTIPEATANGDYYNVSVSYTVEGTLPEGAQISIIALEGYAENAEAADVKVTFDGTTANNVLWIDQQAAAETGTFSFQVDKAKVKDNGFHVKSGVTGGEPMMGYVTIASQPALSDDASLSAISVNGTPATITGEDATATVNAAVTKGQITATTTDDNAEYEVNATEDANVFEIVVTAQDGITKKTYTLTVTVNGGGSDPVDPPAGGETIEKEDITIGGAAVTDPSATVTSTNPFGIEDGHVVKVDTGITTAGEVPTKVVAHNGSTEGVETFYTEYEINGETVIKLVTVITDESLSANELTLVSGTPTKLVYGDIDTSAGTGITSLDVDAIIQISVGNKLVGANVFDRLTADANGDGAFTSLDVDEIIQMSVGNKTVPAAASK